MYPCKYTLLRSKTFTHHYSIHAFIILYYYFFFSLFHKRQYTQFSVSFGNKRQLFEYSIMEKCRHLCGGYVCEQLPHQLHQTPDTLVNIYEIHGIQGIWWQFVEFVWTKSLSTRGSYCLCLFVLAPWNIGSRQLGILHARSSLERLSSARLYIAIIYIYII